jgi:hypothetical protein
MGAQNTNARTKAAAELSQCKLWNGLVRSNVTMARMLRYPRKRFIRAPVSHSSSEFASAEFRGAGGV